MFIGEGFLDNNDGHIGYEFNCLATHIPGAYFPEQYDLDRDGGITNDCRNAAWTLQTNCVDMYDVEDPVLWSGPGKTIVELNIALCNKICASGCEYKWSIPGPYPRDLPFFTIEATDVLFTCGDGDGIDYYTILEEIQAHSFKSHTRAEVDMARLVLLDIEFDFAEWKTKCECNLIMVGGPVANNIVELAVDEGLSAVDWTISLGEWEYIRAPYSMCDILIIAGMDRTATLTAVKLLIGHL